MWNKLKHLLLLNKDDLPVSLGFVAGPWLLIHLVTAAVMLIIRPDESILIAGVLLPITVGLAAFTVTSGNAMITFSYAVKFSSTRKTALTLTLAQTGAETLVATLLGCLLLILERTIAMPFWRFLSSNPALLVDDFGFVWWAIPVGAVVGYLIGLVYGTCVLRFGGKAIWMFFLLWMGFLVIFQHLPWKTHEVTNILIPVLIVLLLLSAVWSVWSLLRLSITK